MRRIVLLCVMAALLWLVPAASGDNGTSQAGYGGEPAVQVTIVKSGQGGDGPTLPLTGLDLGLVFLGGSVLVLVGLGMRRVARQRRDDAA
jgi:hypothetical protein